MTEPTFDEQHGLPSNPYNKHSWVTGEPEIGPGTWIGAFTVIDGAIAAIDILADPRRLELLDLGDLLTGTGSDQTAE